MRDHDGSEREWTLVTGGAGYAGSVLIRLLLAAGHRVRVLDCLRFGGEALLPLLERDDFELVGTDLREGAGVARAVAGCGAVVHLAAVVGDPACAADPELAWSVNRDASLELFRRAEAAGVTRFVFASTCSNYGRTGDDYVTEEAPLAPVSDYARSKVEVEEFLLERAGRDGCEPVCLRFATAYGLSPRMRFDLTLNEFCRDLTLDRELVVYGLRHWRPYCHVRDLMRAVTLVLEAPSERVAGEVFNVGDSGENYTKGMLLEEIRRRVTSGRVRRVERGDDPRSYRVGFDKIRRVVGFRPERRVADGVAEIHRAIVDGLIRDPLAPRHSNLSAARPAASGDAA